MNNINSFVFMLKINEIDDEILIEFSTICSKYISN